MHSQAEPGNEKRCPAPWFPGSAWEPISSGLRLELRSGHTYCSLFLREGAGARERVREPSCFGKNMRPSL